MKVADFPLDHVIINQFAGYDDEVFVFAPLQPGNVRLFLRSALKCGLREKRKRQYRIAAIVIAEGDFHRGQVVALRHIDANPGVVTFARVRFNRGTTLVIDRHFDPVRGRTISPDV